MTVVDLFAGPGGWDIAARTLGIDPVGLEVDADACATRAAAGLRTLRVDLAQFIGCPPPTIRPDVLDLFSGDWPELDLTGGMHGLIASPPCPAFSMAGNGDGRDELPAMVNAVVHGANPPPDLSVDAHLLWMPFDWALHYRPTWMAWEQVPPVLPFFEAVADALPCHGWSTWAGVVNAADYGVPQRRRRAVLLAHQHRTVDRPATTHAGQWVTIGAALGLEDGRHLIPGTYAATGGNRRPYSLDEPAPTIAFGKDMAAWVWAMPDGSRRPLTVSQAAALQTLESHRHWAGTVHSVARQIGNAVPPLLAQRLLEAVTP